MNEPKEIIIDVADERYLYGFYKLLIEKLDLYEWTGMNVDSLSDVLREPWEGDRVVRFINVSKTNNDIRTEIKDVVDLFEEIKEFQNYCGNKFTWTVEE